MTTHLAAAYPRKRFFLEMFTRDISLEDCILDLIDNSIDSLIRTRSIDISSSILNYDAPSNGHKNRAIPTIDVSLSMKEFKISDKCGGISRQDALTDVFNFGHSSEEVEGQLGAYGIGLKRAIFKIGNKFEIESKTVNEGFKTTIDVSEWSEKDEKITDWKIPITFIDGVSSRGYAGTSIVIKELRPEVRMRMNDGTLEVSLRSAIAQTYALFLERFVRVTLNKEIVEPDYLPIGESDEVTAAKDEFESSGVRVTLIAGLASRSSSKKEWLAEKAGWYVLCNGRVVVTANKTDLTGWGAGLPQYHVKYRGFIGIAFFQSKNPLLLPWTTTKRNLNRESPIYQLARNRMSGVARPIITFLNEMYPSEAQEERRERLIAEGIKTADVRSIAQRAPTSFKVDAPKTQPKTTTRISYDVQISDVERVRKCLRQPTWPPKRIGEHTFQYFLDKECPE